MIHLDRNMMRGNVGDAAMQRERGRERISHVVADDIQPAPSFGTRVHVDYLLGMGRAGKRFSLILDIDRVLSASELEVATALVEPAREEEAGGAP